MNERGYRFKQVYQRHQPYDQITTTANSVNIWTNIGGWQIVKEPLWWKRWELWLRACPLWSR